MIRTHRNHAGYVAFLVHRLSGLALALFLPLHFLTLALALDGAAALDAALAWSAHPLLKIAETALIATLAVHLGGGLRLMAMEALPWSDRHKTWIGMAFAASVFAGLVFALNAA